MKLSILIPQFMENEEIIHNLLDSINLQQYVDFKDIEVLIANDGTNVKLSKLFLSRYSYSIKYLKQGHSGISATRNFLLENSTGDYVMFCDADDMFLDSLALSYIIGKINNGFDMLVGSFYESVISDNGNKITFLTHVNDMNFIHNKVFNKRMLIENNIKFDETIEVNEDGQFVGLAMVCSEKTEIGNVINYLWKYRENSTARLDPNFGIKNYGIIIKNADIIITKALNLGKTEKIKEYVNNLLYQAYCILYKRKKEWLNDAFLDVRNNILNKVRVFYNKYKNYAEEASEEVEKSLHNKASSYHKLYDFEDTISYKEFLEKIKEI